MGPKTLLPEIGRGSWVGRRTVSAWLICLPFLLLLLLLLSAACDDYDVPNVTVKETGDGYARLLVGDRRPDSVAEPDWATTGPDLAAETPGEPGIDLEDMPICIGNNDGSIEAGEMPTVVGACVTYSVNQEGAETAVKTTGEMVDGKWTWDFRGIPGLAAASVLVHSPKEFWFAKYFPTGDYATPVSLWDDDVMGVLEQGEGEVRLLGLASATPEEDPHHTLMIYDQPVVVYKFPLSPGVSWTQKGTFSNALLKGVKNAGEEVFKFVVDGRGTVVLPQFTLENTLRLRLEHTSTLVVSAGKPSVKQIQYSFVHECIGEAARILSLADEPATEFEHAAEFRRLGY
jgi:hypothetical protein